MTSIPAPGCASRNAKGGPCGMPPVDGSDRCFVHDPARAAELAAARKQGGRNRRAPGGGIPDAAVSLATVADVRQLLERAVADTLLLENSARRSGTLATLAGVALRVLEVDADAARQAAVEARLTALEARAAIGPRRMA